MGIKIKNLQTGEFEKFNIPALKGEKGEPGEVEPSEKVDYIGKQHSKLRDTMNANVDYIIKTAIGEFNYLDYEGQHITATNSIEGHAKSAILSGQTLVNYATGMAFNLSTGGDYCIGILKNSEMTSNKTITIVNNNSYGVRGVVTDLGGRWIRNINISAESHVTSTLASSEKLLRVDSLPDSGILLDDYANSRFIIYDGNFKDGIYFEGMQSVKMPVLTTTGKNLINYKNYNLNVNVGQNPQEIIVDEQGLSFNVGDASWKSLWYDLYLEKGENYTLSFNTNLLKCFIFKSKVNTYVSSERVAETPLIDATEENIQKVTTTFVAPSTGFIRMRLTNETKMGNIILENLQIEKNKSATTYEPYKSNILSTPEDLELRGIRKVKDELNVATGELTQRIVQKVFNGSEAWYLSADPTENLYFRLNISDILNQEANVNIPLVLSDKYPGKTQDSVVNKKEDGICSQWAGHQLVVKDSTVSTIDEFKAKLSQSPMTVSYIMDTPIIKTVDLSDNHVYSYKDVTHYACSSEDGSLVPTLSVKVPTDTQLTIQEQKATTQTLLIKNMDLQQSIKEVQAMNLAFNTALYNSFNSIREEVEDIKKHVSTNENLEGSF